MTFDSKPRRTLHALRTTRFGFTLGPLISSVVIGMMIGSARASGPSMQATPPLNEVMTAALKAVRETDWSNFAAPPGDARLTTPLAADQPPLTHGILQSYLRVCAWAWQRPISPAEQQRVSDRLRGRWVSDPNYSEQYKILSFGFIPAVLQTMPLEQQEIVRTQLAHELPDGVFPGVDTANGAFPGIDTAVPKAFSPGAAFGAAGVRGSVMSATLLGSWVQDDSGSVVTYRRRYQFNADGSYEFAFTSRQTGSMNQRPLASEKGTFTVAGDQLVISPSTGGPRAVLWRVEKDKYTGNTQLVMALPDGKRDLYYPE